MLLKADRLAALLADGEVDDPFVITPRPNLDELRPNEAASQQLVGRLSAGIEVSWADVFSGPIGPVARLAGTAGPLLINVSAGASLGARVSLTDDFILVISRESDDRPLSMKLRCFCEISASVASESWLRWRRSRQTRKRWPTDAAVWFIAPM